MKKGRRKRNERKRKEKKKRKKEDRKEGKEGRESFSVNPTEKISSGTNQRLSDHSDSYIIHVSRQ